MAGPHGTVGLHLSPWGWCLQMQARAGGSSQLSAHRGKALVLGKLEAPFLWKHQCQIPRELETKQIQSKTCISKLCSWRAPGGAQGGTG